jgi:hypothetical protein
MEWWENDGYEAVDEFGGRVNIGGRQFAGNVGLHGVGASYRNTKGEKTSVHANKKQLLGTAAAGVAAYKLGKWGYNKFKGGNQAPAQEPPQNQPAPTPTQPAHIKGSANTQRGGYSEFEGNGRVREDWEYFDDPGAQMILESYFSEFGDADVFGGPEPEYDNYNEEWDY